ncbi:YbgC/FadM family acyl-CoA thioesterase [Roseomonas sp. PWR1]|uniref:YbgC/FadM family acyl-CoA thioesterase n=1 Tax=Roseomonas nitratireducens TaxID=2820810 RepID=A0ABS4AZK7_9PROT|nr:YbgC/FadM family acyl-CoA thioesterase [Neoroseomonas nitratireducens]MBP0466679.1 YbgC/FadM family acyl-CoA thioesterase [Neoroseomonas nitratireducens]
MTGPEPAASDRIHRHYLRVYFEDTDAGGMAYHARYLHWAERARTESLRAIGLPHNLMIERHGALLVVRRVEVEYWRPARLDSRVVVETAILRVTGAQILLDQTVRLAEEGSEAPGERLAGLKVGLVSVDQAALKPVPLPEPWRSVLKGLVLPAAG